MSEKFASLVNTAKELLSIEAKAIEACAQRLGPEFAQVIERIDRAHTRSKKLVFMGVGKSHYIAAKLAASFMSTGVTAIFMHPSEAIHGDLGALKEGDVVFLISKSGTSAELLSLLPWITGKTEVVAITGNKESPIAKACQWVLDASVEREACPMNLLPTASTTVTLALGDALMASYAQYRDFDRDSFAVFHPGGALGKRLHKKISEILVPLDATAFGPQTMSIKEVAALMGQYPTGAFCVVDQAMHVQGVVTDGDIRRAIVRGDNLSAPVSSIMNTKFTHVSPDLLIDEGIALMESPSKKVYCAPVIDSDGKLQGVVRVHDML
ncbi:MAG TPA: KpsF/GutQ family sugar-phosphate isomerase [Bdellovibrionota bacterium]|jgi:arabinose-5-phosphate isomerase|nr:KpsF/GutQ family sugar-phosphate isomerase [Bdellovibrionota bacterium]